VDTDESDKLLRMEKCFHKHFLTSILYQERNVRQSLLKYVLAGRLELHMDQLRTN